MQPQCFPKGSPLIPMCAMGCASFQPPGREDRAVPRKFDFLRVRSENVPFYAALKWIQRDLSNRKDQSYEILQNIRLLHFTNTVYLQRIVDRFPYEINSPEDCEKFLSSISKRCSKRRLLGSVTEDTLSSPR